MSRRKILCFGLIAGLFGFGLGLAWVVGTSSGRSWKTRLDYREYAHWVDTGGTATEHIFSGLTLDPCRDDAVRGLDRQQLMVKFQFLVDHGTFAANGYKGTSIRSEEHPGLAGILWFSRADGFDWCVLVDQDPSRNSLRLVKG